MSKKRILVALVLAGSTCFVGAHRFYVGRIVSGFIQLGLFAIGIVLLLPLIQALPELIPIFRGLMNINAILNGNVDWRLIDEFQDWIQREQGQVNSKVAIIGLIVLAIPTFWVLVDCVLLMMRKFRDGQGETMTRWF